MDNRYKFHELRGKALPADVNEPVHDMLINALGCKDASIILKEMEVSKACGEIQIFDQAQPKQIKIKTSFGMVEGYDLIKAIQNDGKFTITCLKHIKNHRLSMAKEEGRK
jgi:hypothetical protein